MSRVVGRGVERSVSLKSTPRNTGVYRCCAFQLVETCRTSGAFVCGLLQIHQDLLGTAWFAVEDADHATEDEAQTR